MGAGLPPMMRQAYWPDIAAGGKSTEKWKQLTGHRVFPLYEA